MSSCQQTSISHQIGGLWTGAKAGILALALTIGGLVAGEPKTAAPAADAQRQLQAFLEKWNHAVATHDVAGIRESYSESAVFRWFEDGVLRYRSREEIVGALSQFPTGTRIETTLSEIEAEWLGESRMIGSARFRTRLTMPGQSFEYGGVFTLVVERAGHNWKFLHGHTSTVRPERPR